MSHDQRDDFWNAPRLPIPEQAVFLPKIVLPMSVTYPTLPDWDAVARDEERARIVARLRALCFDEAAGIIESEGA